MTRQGMLVVAIRLFSVAIILYSVPALSVSLAALNFAPAETPVTSTIVVGVHLVRSECTANAK